LVLATESPAAGSAAPEAPRGAELEYLLAELAHELRNPLVTIKTFASHLPALLEDAELRGRFATLTTEAIERMDGLLENVLAFARLGAPHREAVEVGPIMERVLAELEPELAGRALRVRQAVAPTGRCAADPEHLAYALRNLFAGVVREVPAGGRAGRGGHDMSGGGGGPVGTRESPRRRVLIVDDELGVRESLRMALKGNYDVTAVGSGPEALESLAASPPDVVLLDIVMPGV